MDCVRRQYGHGKKQSKRKQKGIKVVYISTPMKVKTSASKFRALVQHLTGRDSDTARFMMEDGFNSADFDHCVLQSSSEESFVDDRDSLVFNQEQQLQQQQQQTWEESLEGQMCPFSSLFVNDHSNFNYYHHDDQLDVGTDFDSLL